MSLRPDALFSALLPILVLLCTDENEDRRGNRLVVLGSGNSAFLDLVLRLELSLRRLLLEGRRASPSNATEAGNLDADAAGSVFSGAASSCVALREEVFKKFGNKVLIARRIAVVSIGTNAVMLIYSKSLLCFFTLDWMRIKRKSQRKSEHIQQIASLKTYFDQSSCHRQE
jgi:hypothetical protein